MYKFCIVLRQNKLSFCTSGSRAWTRHALTMYARWRDSIAVGFSWRRPEISDGNSTLQNREWTKYKQNARDKKWALNVKGGGGEGVNVFRWGTFWCLVGGRHQGMGDAPERGSNVKWGTFRPLLTSPGGRSERWNGPAVDVIAAKEKSPGGRAELKDDLGYYTGIKVASIVPVTGAKVACTIASRGESMPSENLLGERCGIRDIF